jgi:hypothetical protein
LKARATAGGAVQTLLDELLLVWRQDLRWCQLAGGVGPDRVPQEVARLLQDVVEADEVSCHLEARHYPAERHGSAQGLDILGVDAAVDVRVEVHLGIGSSVPEPTPTVKLSRYVRLNPAARMTAQRNSFEPQEIVASRPLIGAAFHGRHGTGFVPGARFLDVTRDMPQPTQNPLGAPCDASLASCFVTLIRS